MGVKTGIQWTDATWNPWVGCLKVSPGCKNCYMYRDQERFGKDPRDIHRTAKATFQAPLNWKEAKRVFTCSFSDFFIEQADEWRPDAWKIIKDTPHLTYQILTKRVRNIEDRLPKDWGSGYRNVWLGVSVESESYAWRLAYLQGIPAWKRFVSYEPALGEVDWEAWLQPPIEKYEQIDWVISGGESGPNFREAKMAWFDKLATVCKRYGIPHFHTQHGGTKKEDGAFGGYKIYGETHRAFPY